MGLRIKGRSLVQELLSARCEKCQKIYSDDKNYCPTCGSKLIVAKTKIYANYGKNGITSFTYVLPNGITFNSKGVLTTTLAKVITYTKKIK